MTWIGTPNGTSNVTPNGTQNFTWIWTQNSTPNMTRIQPTVSNHWLLLIWNSFNFGNPNVRLMKLPTTFVNQPQPTLTYPNVALSDILQNSLIFVNAPLPFWSRFVGLPSWCTLSMCRPNVPTRCVVLIYPLDVPSQYIVLTHPDKSVNLIPWWPQISFLPFLHRSFTL